MFEIYSMKPMQISGPWNDDATTAHPSWEGMALWGGVKGIGGNVPL